MPDEASSKAVEWRRDDLGVENSAGFLDCSSVGFGSASARSAKDSKDFSLQSQ